MIKDLLEALVVFILAAAILMLLDNMLAHFIPLLMAAFGPPFFTKTHTIAVINRLEEL